MLVQEREQNFIPEQIFSMFIQQKTGANCDDFKKAVNVLCFTVTFINVC